MALDYVATLNRLLRYARDFDNLSTDDRDSYYIMYDDLVKALQQATISQFERPTTYNRPSGLYRNKYIRRY